MRYVYSLLLYLLIPAILLYMLARGVSDRGWWHRWPERFGIGTTPGGRGGFLVHAVSVGEANAAAPLIRALKHRWPQEPVTVTCFTPTGSERIRSLFGDAVHHAYAPLDLPGAVRRFLDSVRPRFVIVMETEIWPNLFHHARARGIPILIANARLTNRSLRGWGRFAGLARRALRCVDLVAAQSEEDAERFIELGADPAHTRPVGNLKFDLTLPDDLDKQAAALRGQWGAERLVLAAGSTHEGDERPLFEAFGRILRHHPDALLVLAPRYPERFSRVAERAADAGLCVGKTSEPGQPTPETQCLVIDRMGELLKFYAASDLAFVGGTLARVGGHNPLEPAALGKPLLLGPHSAHIEALAAELIEAGAAIRVDDADALHQAWSVLLDDTERRGRMGEAAGRLVKRKQGALARTLQAVEALLFE